MRADGRAANSAAVALGRWLVLASTTWVAAQVAVPAEPGATIAGCVIAAGGGALPDEVFAELAARAGGRDAPLVIIPTASQDADADGEAERTVREWGADGFGDVTVLHTRDRSIADREDFVAPLLRARAVWISGGDQSRLTAAYRGTRVQRELWAVVARGGVVGGSSAGAAILSETMIAGGRREPELGLGLGLLPRFVVDQHFTQRGRLPRLQRAIALHPALCGLGLDEGTALVMSGRQAAVLGRGSVQVVLGAGAGREEAVVSHPAGATLDLEQLRRAARARGGEAFPGEATRFAPVIGGGTLLLAGGGALPDAILARFVAAAGGPDAPIVVVPTAESFAAPRREPAIVAALRRAGAQAIAVWHETDPARLADPTVLAPLRGARGLWFTGGRQWRLVDAYEGTPAWDAFRDVVARGGVIGGSSAGATIQGEYLVRGHPLGNAVMMAEGYERGLGVLAGTAVDQHFTQRRRHDDLAAVVARFPQLHGLGLDEGTAAIVAGDRLEVVGRGGVTVLARGAERVLRDGESLRLPLEPDRR
ncbi:MAG: cyanophycinase [Planctomycetes bacterium]|nr:cyanophycinase [Planctomycetota bacterium]